MTGLKNIEEFHQSYNFFMYRPNNSFYLFIFIVITTICVAFLWSLIAKMDDIVKADVLLRPAASISLVKTISGGEIQKKNYYHDAYVNEGDLLLQLDVTADNLELMNSHNTMERIENQIDIYSTLLVTIQTGKNAAENIFDETYIYSERYILDYTLKRTEIDELKIRFEREKSLPELMQIKHNLELMERDIEQAELQHSIWNNNQIIETTSNLKNLMQNKENLERHISDLERNIRNATIHAPISGRINENRRLNVGDNIMPGEEIIAIIPDTNTELKAELYIESAYIAKVKVGQKIILRFPSLPPSKYGKMETEISLIPADYVMGADNRPIFIVEAGIPRPWLESSKGEKIFLRAGISAIGRVIVDHDTVLMMILKKLDFIDESISK